MDVKAAFTGHDQKSVLASCEFGEDAALAAYNMALKEDGLPAQVHSMVSHQRDALKVSHDKIKALRDSLA